MVNITASGFRSDVRTSERHVFNERLVTVNRRRIDEIYDRSNSTVLGKGLCGVVSTVTKRETGELYALKTISLEGMSQDVLDELRKEIDIMMKTSACTRI